MVNWSELTKRTLPFSCSNATQDKTKAHKARKACRHVRHVWHVLIIGKAHRHIGMQTYINYG